MNETLILIAGRSPNEPIKWAFWADGRVQLADTAESVDALGDVAHRAASAKRVALVLAGEDVVMRIMPTPPKANAQYKSAAKFLLEDELAESLDNIHFATARHSDGAGLVLAVKKSVIDLWAHAFTSIGIKPDVVTADYVLLPSYADRATVFATKDRLFGSVGLQGFALERPLADEILPTLLEKAEIENAICYGEATLPLTDTVHTEWRHPLEGAALISTFADGLEQSGYINFLQGAYRKSGNWKETIKPWRRAAMLAAGLVVSFLVVDVADSIRSLRIAEAYRQETNDIHVATFPEFSNVDPKTHARQVLAAGGGAPMFMRLTNAVSDSLGESDNIQLDRIRYNAQRGEYAINLRFSDINDLEVLKQNLEARGIIANEAGGVRRSGGIYLGELKVSLS
ncbi:type II secretion system protein GspL [Hyphococcus lacteus]|uniref:Type II secretion system protein GspL n=1 Tax=Hyphococcus lacteus TaxID=3143536 RepID=A0ABV3Z5Y2_9PROT